MLSQKFLNWKCKPSRRPITTAKKIRKGAKGKVKKIEKTEKPKDVGHFRVVQSLIKLTQC